LPLIEQRATALLICGSLAARLWVAAMEIHAEDYLRGMAFHEAGHAVVAWSLNLRVESIYISEIDAGNSATKTDPPDHLPLMDQLATLAAGVEAEREFKSPLPEHAGDRDRLMAINLIRTHHKGLASDEIQSHLAAGHARARELLIEHREQVIRVAEHLRDVRQVQAAEFTRLMTA
jgi:ATP-dependent Zn protease